MKAAQALSAHRPTVLYVIGTYPSLTTTFIDREIVRLRDLGTQIFVLSLRPVLAGTAFSSQQKRLAKETIYLLPPHFGRVVWATLFYAVSRPHVCIRLLLWLISRPHPRLKDRCMTLIHFLEGVYAAHVVSDRTFDHIHAHFLDRTATVALIVSRLHKCGFSVTAHANDIFRHPVLVPEKIAQAKFVVTVAEYNRCHLLSTLPEGSADRISVIHPWVDLCEFDPATQDPEPTTFRIVSVGRLVEKKGHRYLVEACARLRERGLLLECLIVGDGPLRRELAAQIKRNSLKEEVRLLGACSGAEVRQHLKRCSVFCLPCVVAEDGDRDGIPVALAEAMALEIPVVSTRVVGVPELVQPEAGLLVSSRDSNGLAEALNALAEDPELRRRLGKRGRGVVARDFELSAGISRLARLFAQAVEPDALVDSTRAS